MLVIVNFLVTIGKLVALLLAYIFLDSDLKHGNYKTMMVVSCLPMFFVLYFNITYIEESPRFLLAN